jgi:hypothetical protein
VQKRLRRILYHVISYLPGGAWIAYGLHIRAVRWTGKRPLYEITGEQAVAFSWFIIGVGLWGIAFCGAPFENRPLLRGLLYVAAGILCVYGFAFSFK